MTKKVRVTVSPECELARSSGLPVMQHPAIHSISAGRSVTD